MSPFYRPLLFSLHLTYIFEGLQLGPTGRGIAGKALVMESKVGEESSVTAPVFPQRAL